MAFRKRQNTKLKEAKPDVLAVFKRVLEHDNQGDEAALRALFKEASDKLAGLGLPLGGSEEWADRLYIEGKDGSLLFAEDELDLAEEAQKRMEVMYNIDTWATQLSSRLANGKALLAAELAEGHKRTNPEDLVSRAVKRLNDDCRYHKELFDEPSARVVFESIEALGLPHSLNALGEQLLQQCAELLGLAVRSLGAMAAAAESHKIKAMRNAAAQRAMTSIEQVKATFPALQERGVRGAGEQTEALARLVEKLAPHLPAEVIESDDDEYY